MFRYSQLCEEITEKYSDLLGPLPLKLPPFCEVSHKIPLIDESKQLKHRLPKCPEVFHSKLAWKIERYTTTGWWVLAATKQVTPMLCIPKKNGTLRNMFDLQQQNKNTWKDVTPFPDQDAIRHDIAQAKFRSKLCIIRSIPIFTHFFGFSSYLTHVLHLQNTSNHAYNFLYFIFNPKKLQASR